MFIITRVIFNYVILIINVLTKINFSLFWEVNNLYKIGYEDKDIVIRLSKDEVDKETLSRFLDYIKLESIRKRSKLSKAQANKLAKEVDQEVWRKVQDIIEVK